jgi:hypothetical protein
MSGSSVAEFTVVIGVLIASLGVGYVRAATSVSRSSNLSLVDLRFAVRV